MPATDRLAAGRSTSVATMDTPVVPAVVRLADHAAGPRDQPQHRAPHLLLLHGGSGSHNHWTRIIGPLSQAFHVHAPDLPGYGESPDVPGDPDGNAYVALVAASLEALVPATEPVHIVGFSFGGAVSAGVARLWGDRVRKLTLIGPGGFGKPVGRRLDTRNRSDTDGSVAALREVARHNLGVMMLHDATRIDDATVDLQMWNLDHTRFDSLRVSYQDRLLDDLAHIAAPVQLMIGGEDVFPHPSIADRVARVRAVRPDADIAVVPGGGHWVQHECPDAVVRLLIDFHAPATAPVEKS